MWSRLVLTLAHGLGAIATPAAARSTAAAYLVKQEIAGACESGRGSIDPASVIERDLDGDGRSDLVIAHEGNRCKGPNGRSLACGMQVCDVIFYLRRGPLLEKVHEMLGGGVHVGKGRIPTVFMYAHGGSQGSVRWNGRGFD